MASSWTPSLRLSSPETRHQPSQAQHSPRIPLGEVHGSFYDHLLRTGKHTGVRTKHTKCIRCRKVRSLAHRRDWVHCSERCLYCPDDKQHFGEPCPHVVFIYDTHWWRHHANMEKPRVPPSVLEEARDAIRSSYDTLLRREGVLNFPKQEARSQLSQRRRSRSPVLKHESRNYRDRSTVPKSGGRVQSEQCASMGNALGDPGSSAGPKILLGRQSSLGESFTAQDTPSSRQPKRQTNMSYTTTPSSGQIPHIPNGGSVNDHGSGIGRPSGFQEQMFQDPVMRMIVQQTVVFADFLQRHPHFTYGEQIVSNGMIHYLQAVRTLNPQYLVPEPYNLASSGPPTAAFGAAGGLEQAVRGISAGGGPVGMASQPVTQPMEQHHDLAEGLETESRRDSYQAKDPS